MGPGKLRGCGRGVFGLKSWEPLRRPGNVSGSSHSQSVSNGPREGQQRASAAAPANASQSAPTKKQRMVSKYTYKANTDSPLGKELSMKPGEKLFFINPYPENSHWWLAQNDEGESGYVPASYMQILEDEQPGLPWLQNKEEEEEPTGNNTFGAPAKGTYKPYKSSYNHDQQDMPKKYFCEICDKQLNGPKPYSAHMISKAHKEMEEYLKT